MTEPGPASFLLAQAQAEYDAQPWEAVIEPGGRWTWHVRLRRGLVGTQGSIVTGSRARAERVARRWLAAQRRKDARHAEQFVIR